MNVRATLPLVLALAGSLCGIGCDASGSYRAVVREQVDAYTELEEILATVVDESSMEAAGAKLKERQAAFDAVVAKAQRLGKPSADVLEQISDDARRLLLVRERVQRQVRRILELPGGRDFLLKFAGVKSFLPPD